MSFTVSEIDEIVLSVWHTLLPDLVEALEAEEAPEVPEAVLGASVEITGGWHGRVTVSCSPDLALHLGSVMFGRTADALEPDDLRDAVGEVANLVGGNVKALIEGNCDLSLPFPLESHPTEPLLLRGFRCPVGEMTVSISPVE